METVNILQSLAQKIPHQWKVQGKTSTGKVTCVAYIDSRDVQDILDKVCGLNWGDETEFISEVNNIVTYKSTISIGIGEYVCKRSDIGSFEIESSQNKQDYNKDIAHKGAASDAFKRAAVKFGIGRFLYDLDIVYLDNDVYEANKWKLTEYINSTRK